MVCFLCRRCFFVFTSAIDSQGPGPGRGPGHGAKHARIWAHTGVNRGRAHGTWPTICLLFVNYLCSICERFAHYLPTITTCPLFTNYLLTIAQFVHYSFTICPLFDKCSNIGFPFHYLYIICRLLTNCLIANQASVHNLSFSFPSFCSVFVNIDQLFANSLPTTCPLRAHYVPTTCPLLAHYPWIFDARSWKKASHD